MPHAINVTPAEQEAIERVHEPVAIPFFFLSILFGLA